MTRLDIAPAGGGGLDLPLMSWNGGSDYYTVAQTGPQMAKAESMGWSDPSFFPISVFLSNPSQAETLADCGINLMHGSFGIPDALEMAADAGIFVLPQHGDALFTTSYVNSSTNCPGWLMTDEPDLNMSLTAWQALVDSYRALDDGRFMATNFGNMVLAGGGGPCPGCHAGWGTTPDVALQYADVVGCDKYTYTSPYVRELFANTFPGQFPPNWPGDVGDFEAAQCAFSYGWQIDQLREFDDPDNRRPTFITVETKMPFISEGPTGSPAVYEYATVPLYDEIEGAVWSAIAHGANGIMYFQHNGHYLDGMPAVDPNTGLAPCTSTLSITECEAGLRTRITAINGQVADMATVLNTQPYVFDFGAADIDTRLQAPGDGFAYIFASVGFDPALGSKTFTLSGSGITGTSVEVLYESRSISVSGGQFTDTFAAEYSHHIYKVAI